MESWGLQVDLSAHEPCDLGQADHFLRESVSLPVKCGHPRRQRGGVEDRPRADDGSSCQGPSAQAGQTGAAAASAGEGSGKWLEAGRCARGSQCVLRCDSSSGCKILLCVVMAPCE